MKKTKNVYCNADMERDDQSLVSIKNFHRLVEPSQDKKSHQAGFSILPTLNGRELCSGSPYETEWKQNTRNVFFPFLRLF